METANSNPELDAVTKSNSLFLSDYERGWLSGLIDSEGCIGKYRDYRYPHEQRFHWKLDIGNTNIALLQRAQSLIGGSINVGTVRRYQCFHLFIYKRATLFRALSQIVLIQKETARQQFLREYLCALA